MQSDSPQRETYQDSLTIRPHQRESLGSSDRKCSTDLRELPYAEPNEQSNKKFLVYCLRNTLTGKRYVGFTGRSLKIRWRQHQRAAIAGVLTHLYNAIRLDGADCWDVRIIAELETAQEACLLEVFFISLFETSDSTKGYNMTFGGEGCFATPEVRLKMRMRKLGTRQSLEHRMAISLARSGQKLKPQTPEHRQKLRLTRVGVARNIKPVRQLSEDGNTIQVHRSLKTACESVNCVSPVVIRNCCNGKTKTAFGFRWEWA